MILFSILRKRGRRSPMSDATMPGVQQPPPLGGYLEVMGRRLWFHRAGSGSPPVVFLPGGGAIGLDYWNVHDRVARLTTSVLYDRAGTGWSERVDLRRTSAEVIDEARELLRMVALPAPYLLVGHSLGGLYARHWATRFPADITGLVLLDPAHEDYATHMPKELAERYQAWDPDQTFPDQLPEQVVQLYRDLFARETVDWPESIRRPLIERHVSPEWLRIGFKEASNVNRIYDEVRQRSLPDVPLIILCSMAIDGFKEAVSTGVSESLLRGEIEGKQRLYEEFAQAVPRGEVRLIDGGHVTMHLRHPEAVVQAIQDLISKRLPPAESA
jgi:pimeloyl-ACP methyl ester carboxylesterase